MKILVINLESARERRSNILRQFEGSTLQPILMAAYDGHDAKFPFWRYRHLAGRFWDNESEFKPGAFCCYLSHAKCWSKVASGNADYALVLEDDVEIDIEAIVKFTVDNPTEFDLIFVNQRTSNYLKHHSGVVPDRVDVGALIARLIKDGTFSRRIPAPGADGYVVSKVGAAKCLRMMNTRGICMGVDYALVLNSLDSRQIEALRKIDTNNLPFSTRCFLANEARAPTEPININAWVHTGNPLVKLGSFDSTIKHEFRLPNQAFDLSPGQGPTR